MSVTTDNTPPAGWEGILHPGERILWQGRPSGKVSFAGLDPRRTLFGMVFFGFALFWTWTALTTDSAPIPIRVIAPMIGLFFVVQGARLSGADRIWQAFVRQRSWYTLTSQRALIATEVFGRRNLMSWPITPRTVIDFVEGSEQSVLFADTGGRFSGRRRIGFELIEDGREVLSLMRQVQRGPHD